MTQESLMIKPNELIDSEYGGFKFEKKNIYWSNLKGIKSKYTWTDEVFSNITEYTGNKMSKDVIKYIEVLVEKFIDEKLDNLTVTGFEPSNFGYIIVEKWFNIEKNEAMAVSELSTISKWLQEAYESEFLKFKDDETDVQGLLVKIVSKFFIEFLSISLNVMMNSTTRIKELTLFFCLYTIEHDGRFSILKDRDMSAFLPEVFTKKGYTVTMLRQKLPIYIKNTFGVRPYIEDGVLEILANSSNMILINDKSRKISKFVDIPQNTCDGKDKVFFNLHRYILYLIFRYIRLIMKNNKSEIISNSIAFDALTMAKEDFLKNI